MKIAFIFVTVLCALALGVISYIFATGNIPFKETPALPVASAPAMTTNAAPFSLSSADKAQIDQLIKDLEAEKQAFAAKRLELEQEQNKAKMQASVEILGNFKRDIQKLDEELKSQMRALEETEAKNLKGLSEKYSQMEPANAAQIMKKMDKRRAAGMLSLMNERQAAAILDEMVLLGEAGITNAVEWTDIIRKMKSEETRKEETTP